LKNYPSNLQLKSVRFAKSYKLIATSTQLERASSSIGANICESSYGASRKDFINKLRIASKEASECVFWMSLLKQSGYDKITNESLIHLQHIQMMLNKSIATAVKNSNENTG